MIDRRVPIGPRQRSSLSVRDGYKRLVPKPVEYADQVRKVEAPVQSCDVRNPQLAANRKMQVSSMKMNQIELVNVLNHVIYEENFPRHRIFAALILPQRPLARRNKSR